MPKRAFRYARDEIWATKAEGIRMLRGGIRMLETEFGCPRGHSDTIKGLLHGGYLDGRNVHLDIH